MSKKRYLFHGATKDGKDSIIENGIKLDVNNGKQDFGPGFYLTPNKGLARSRKKHNSEILAYTIDTKDLKIKSYPSMTKEWKEEVLQQRAYGNDVSKDFDCVIGPIADGAVGPYAEALASGDVTKNENEKIYLDQNEYRYVDLPSDCHRVGSSRLSFLSRKSDGSRIEYR